MSLQSRHFPIFLPADHCLGAHPRPRASGDALSSREQRDGRAGPYRYLMRTAYPVGIDEHIGNVRSASRLGGGLGEPLECGGPQHLSRIR
jgi:hypothetical protein